MGFSRVTNIIIADILCCKILPTILFYETSSTFAFINLFNSKRQKTLTADLILQSLLIYDHTSGSLLETTLAVTIHLMEGS